jgi:ABC-2 type transport system ATP-binding protein
MADLQDTPRSSDAVIDIRGITKRFGSTVAVDDVSFRVHRGEVLGFLGPNAAGKTTTMRILTCYLAPDEGTASVAGYDIRDHSLEVRRRLGYLPESAPLYLDMGVVEHLEFVAEMRGIAANDVRSRVRDMIDACGLRSVLHMDVGQLSKGYRQRVGLAITMIHDPDILILDEPTTGLDPSQIIEIRELIKRIGTEKTVILSTHILPEVEATSSRVLIINEGKIVASGTPSELAGMAASGEEIRITALAPGGELEAALRGLPHTVSVETLGQEEDGYVSYGIRGDDGTVLADSVFNLVRDRGWRLRELRRESASLEDIFLRITRGEGAGEGGREDGGPEPSDEER